LQVKIHWDRHVSWCKES